MKQADFVAGFRAILPFWLGAAPIAFTYVLTARADGFSNLYIQLMSLFVFSAAVQLNTLQLLRLDAANSVILVTAFLLSVHQILLGIALQRRLKLSRRESLVVALVLTDAAYGVAHHQRDLTVSYLLGAGCSMFVAWNGFTLLALFVSRYVTISTRWQLDFAIPLIFLILLVPLLNNWTNILVAVIAGTTMQIATAAGIGPGSILLAILPACLIGAWLTRHHEPSAEMSVS